MGVGVGVGMGRTSVIGAGAASPIPTDDLHAWWKSDTGVLTDVDGVYEWEDQSGNGHSLKQATGSKKPQVASANLNGIDTIDPDGVDDLLSTDAWTELSQPTTIYIVTERNPTNGKYTFDGLGSTKRHAFFDDENRIFAGAILDPTVGRAAGWSYWSLHFNTTSSEIWQNGNDLRSGTPGDAGSQGLTGLRLFAQWNQANVLALDAAEIIIYNAYHGTAVRQELETYFADRYAL